MPIHKSLNAESGHTRGGVPLRGHGRPHAVALVLAAGVLVAGLGLGSEAMDGTGGGLQPWQDQLSNGLQISLRAVADGRDTLADAAPARLENASFATQGDAPRTDGRDGRQHTVRADLSPRSLPPAR